MTSLWREGHQINEVVESSLFSFHLSFHFKDLFVHRKDSTPHAPWISIFMREKNHTFLPVIQEIKIISIMEDQFILSFYTMKYVAPNNITMDFIENQDAFFSVS